MQWFADNITQTVLVIGIILLIVEVAVLGFSTFFLFFAGLGAIVTSILMYASIIPESFLYSIASIAIFTIVFAIALWKPMIKMQKSVDKSRASSDLVGHTFVLPQSIIATLEINDKPLYQFSGIQWRLQSENDIEKGCVVEVSQADVGVLWVKAKLKQA